MITLCSGVFAQIKTVHYTIISKKDSVGSMQATQKITGDETVYNLASIVEMKVLMNIRVNVQDEAHYRKDKLLSASSRRIVNEKSKGDKKTKADGDTYIITDDGKVNHLNQKIISYDFSKLYFKEPVGISQLYSLYYQKMLTIKTISTHVYKIDLPEGGFNTYYYENGACKKVDIRGTLFNAQMILNE